jgi:hypothetical protein
MNLVRSADSTFPEMWSRLFAEDAFQYPLLTPLDVDYSKEYTRESKFEDVSFIAEENGAPLMGVRAAIREHPDGRKEISGFGRPIGFFEAQTMAASSRNGAAGMVREELQAILQAPGITSARHLEYRPVLSPVSRLLLDTGGIATPRFSQVIDLSLSEADLRARIRKSYKSLINWGTKTLALRLLDHTNITSEDMEQFRLFHAEVAGRETRSRRTWELQSDAVRAREAFVVLGDIDQQLVTAAYFPHSPKFCIYGVSASKRELFEKPLGHIVLWTAILHAKKIGCQFFESGEQVFPNHGTPPPSSKELNISGFKKGFGGETYPWLKILWTK